MLLPSFWRGRPKNDPVRHRIAQFRAVLNAALDVPFYRKQMDAAGLRALDLHSLEDIPKILNCFAPVSWDEYTSLFAGRTPGWRQRPDQRQTRSAIMLPYAEARAGMRSCRVEPGSFVDLYSPGAIATATADLYRLSKALAAPSSHWDSDCAVVVFSGMDAGTFTAEQRDHFWNTYQVPVFEQFVGTDGCVIASECEVHAGLHVRLDAAVFETAGTNLILTSLSDLESPAIRVRTNLKAPMELEGCDCGRVEPRIAASNTFAQPNTRAAAA